MDFYKLIECVNNENIEDKDVLDNIISNININGDNFNEWVECVFSDDINKFNMSKLPYLIDGLYKTDDKGLFMLCCMLIESSCDKLDFITNLEDYLLFEAKFLTLVNTLVTVYDRVDNGIANCMSLILINNDPKFTFLTDEQKDLLCNATIRKLNDIYDYLKGDDINPIVYSDLEVIIDLACYLNNKVINDLIMKFDELEDNGDADIFIIKYKLANNIEIKESKVNKCSSSNLLSLYKILEDFGYSNKYLVDIKQEDLALEEMKRWLCYPTELGTNPDMIELLGEIIYNDEKVYVYKFSKEGFSHEGELIGISGGYPVNGISSKSSGYTFSRFDKLDLDWKKQAFDLVEFIAGYWKNRAN